MVQIKDLEVRQGNVDIMLDIVDKGDVREFQKFGRSGRVCTAVGKDETGEVKLTLWNDDVDKVNKGDKVHLTNGYVNEFQGEKQLTSGKFGKIEVVGSGSGDEASSEEAGAESKPEAPMENVTADGSSESAEEPVPEDAVEESVE